MNNILKYSLFLLLFPIFYACHDIDEGYLVTTNAEYTEGDTLVIRKIADKIKDKERIANQAPWATLPIVGLLGTNPITFDIYEVKASNGGNARIFREKDLSVRGLGRMEVQLYPEAPRGTYVVSLQVSAADHTALLEDIYTFIIE